MASTAVPKKQKEKEKEKKMMKRNQLCKTKNLRELKILGQQLLSSRSHINILPVLLSYVKPASPPDYALESVISLHSFFTPLLPDLTPSSSSSRPSHHDSSEFIYFTWMRSNFDRFVTSLFSIAISSSCDQTLREVALDTIMEFVKLGKGGNFHFSLYQRFLRAIVHSTLGVTDLLLQLLVSNYFKYIDVRYFSCISLEKMAITMEAEDLAEVDSRNQLQGSMEHSIHKIYHFLSKIQPLDGSNEESGYEMWSCEGIGTFSRNFNKKNHDELLNAEDKKQNSEMQDEKDVSAISVTKKLKLKFCKAWISFLRLTLPLDVYKEVLSTLHLTVIPHLSNPIMLCDFLTRSYDIGGVVSVMALSSLYILMTQHGLEYPNFFEKLYDLLEPSIFMAKYRAKFFQLIDSCLKSPLLPAYLASSFCKKLSRLALSVLPSGALIIIALVHNLLRRHASINFLVHQEDVDETAKEISGTKNCDSDGIEDTFTRIKRGIDHFNDEQSDPIKTNAMRSSLWEIDTLRHHYCPPVSRFVLSLENDLTVRAKTTEVSLKDFSSGSYATIFGAEIRRRVKQVPLAFYKSTPGSLFSEFDFPGWTFSFIEDPVSINDDNMDSNASTEQIHTSVKRRRTNGV